MLEAITGFFQQNSDLAIHFAVNIVVAVVVLIAGWAAAGWVRRLVIRMLSKRDGVDETIIPIIASMARYTVLILVLATVLARFGVQTASIITVIGAAGLAIGLALQGTLSNLAASVMILFLRPFKVGEFIDAGGVAGAVEEIGLFLSRLRSADSVYISVPNSQLWGCPVTNFSRHPTRRIDLAVGIGYSDDIDQAEGILATLMDKDQRVLADPAPEVMVNSLDDSAVTLNMRCWVNREDFWGVTFDLTKTVKLSLDGAGISIPYPQHDVHLINQAA